MRTIMKLLTVMGGGGGVVSLLRDDFLTADAAPMTTPRVCEPGPGSLVLVQLFGTMAITAQQEWDWVGPTGGNRNFENQYGVSSESFAHQSGRALIATFNFSSVGSSGVGLCWSDAQAVNEPGDDWVVGLQVGAGAFAYDNKALVNLGFALSTGVDYLCYLIKRTLGFFLVIGGNLEWVGVAAGSDGIWPAITNYDASFLVKQRIVVRDMQDSFATDYGVAVYYDATPTANDVFSANADGMIEFTWTPAGGETLNIMFRRTDDNNTLICRCIQASNNIQCFSKEAGVETSLGVAQAQTWTAGVARRIVVKFYGTTIKTWVANTIKNQVTSSVNQAVAGGKVTGFATASELASWPRGVTPQYPFDGLPVYDAFYVSAGDSKTWLNLYQPTLTALLNTATGQRWRDIYPRPAYNGQTLAQLVAHLSADIAALNEGTPTYWLLNVGANDVVSLPAEATWKANLRTYLQTVHTALPDCLIYIMQVWRRNEAADCDTLDGWIVDVVAEAEFLSYAFVGPDERVFLEGGDDGVTNTSDGIHPNAAGAILTAQAWFDELSL